MNDATPQRRWWQVRFTGRGGHARRRRRIAIGVGALAGSGVVLAVAYRRPELFEPLVALQVRAKRYLRDKLADIAEHASLWRLFGSQGETLQAIEDAAELVKRKTGRMIHRNALRSARSLSWIGGIAARVARGIARLDRRTGQMLRWLAGRAPTRRPQQQ